MLTQEELRAEIEYNPEDGYWRWKHSGKFNNRTKGWFIGYYVSHNYVAISINGKQYLAHRLAWFYMTGSWPKEVDHINNIKYDNRWSNLQVLTHLQNMQKSRKERRKHLLKILFS